MAAAPMIIAAGASLASAAQKQTSADIEAGQAEVAAKQQDLQVKQREADRKDRLASAISAQNARSGAAGIAAFEGSPLTVLEDSIEREQVATERDTLSTELSTLAIRSGASIRKKMKGMNARLGLLQTAASLSRTGGGVGG